MSFFNRYFFIFTIISYISLHASQERDMKLHVLTESPFIRKIKEKLNHIDLDYSNERYSLAANNAASVVRQFEQNAQEQTTSTGMSLLNSAHYFFARCHLETDSQQCPWRSLQKICDVPTVYGTLTCEYIGDCLYEKAESIEYLDKDNAVQLQSTAKYYKYAIPYTNYKEALSDNDPFQVNAALKKIQTISDKQTTIRHNILQAFNKKIIPTKSHINTFFDLELDPDFDNNMSLFFSTDAPFIIPLLEQQLTCASSQATKNFIHYILGLLYYYGNDCYYSDGNGIRLYHQNYSKASAHFSQTDAFRTDLITQCRELDSFLCSKTTISYQQACQATEKIKIVCMQKKQSKRVNHGINLRQSLITQHALPIAFALLENNDYQKALDLASSCLQHNEIYQIGLDIIKLIQQFLDATHNNYHHIINSPAYRAIAKHFKQNGDDSSLHAMHPIAVKNALEQNNNHCDEFTLCCIEYALKNNSYSNEETNGLHRIVGNYYYTLSKQTSQPLVKQQHINKAIEYNNQEAIFAEASKYYNEAYVAQHVRSQEKIDEVVAIFDALKNLTSENYPTDTRLKALELLIDAPFDEIAFNNNDEPFILGPNTTQQHKYMQKAYDLGSKKHLKKLASHYTDLPRPDHRQAYSLRKQALQKEKSAQAYNELAELCYQMGSDYYNKANNYFTEAFYLPESNLTNLEKRKNLIYRSLIALNTLTPPRISLAYSLSEEALTLATSESTFFLGSIISTLQYESLLYFAELLMSDNQTDPNTLFLCMIIGRTYIEGKHRNDINAYKQRAYKCLEYAANNKLRRAMGLVISENIQTVHSWKKLEYIYHILAETTTENYESMHNVFSPYLELYSPKTIQEKYDYIIHLSKTANSNPDFSFLSAFLVSDYCMHIPENEYLMNNNAIALLFYNDTSLKKYRDDFLIEHKSGAQTFTYNRGAAFIYAYALMLSDDLKLLNISASYFNKLADYNRDNANPLISICQGLCFYKIGMHHTHNSNTTLAHSFLEKSAALGNEEAIAHLNTTNNGYKLVLLSPEQISTKVLETLSQKINPINFGLIHPSSKPSSKVITSTNNEYVRALSHANEHKRKTALTKLSQKDHIEATFALARWYCKENNIEKAQEFLTKGLQLSFIKHSPDDSRYYFKRDTALSMFTCTVTKDLIMSKELIQEVKKFLIHYKINLNNFVKYAKALTNVDLSQHPHWKK